MDIPTTITTDQDKLKYLYRVEELLRLEHNERGKEFRDGKVNEKDFRDYQRNDFEPRNQVVHFEINNILEREGITYKEDMFAETTEKQDLYEQLKQDGKVEAKWDNEINLKEIRWQ